MQQYHYNTRIFLSNIRSKVFSFLALGMTLIFFFVLSTECRAQKMEGTVRYIMTENFIKKMAAVDYLSKQEVENLNYSYGNRADYKSYAMLYLNATQSKYEDSDESAEKDDAGYSWRKTAYTITRDYEKGTMRDVIDLLDKTYIIEDSLRAPKWKILREMKEIAGHICMNASWTDTIKKQKVVAWYALDIPNGGGPERFFGLSGLILEVNINDGALVITADKIEQKKLTTELDFPKKIKGKKINEIEYFAILRKFFAERRKAEQPPFWGIRY